LFAFKQKRFIWIPFNSRVELGNLQEEEK